jgi:hypothetical protein
VSYCDWVRTRGTNNDVATFYDELCWTAIQLDRYEAAKAVDATTSSVSFSSSAFDSTTSNVAGIDTAVDGVESEETASGVGVRASSSADDRPGTDSVDGEATTPAEATRLLVGSEVGSTSVGNRGEDDGNRTLAAIPKVTTGSREDHRRSAKVIEDCDPVVLKINSNTTPRLPADQGDREHAESEEMANENPGKDSKMSTGKKFSFQLTFFPASPANH